MSERVQPPAIFNAATCEAADHAEIELALAQPRDEAAAASPIGVVGAAKLARKVGIHAICCQYLILRTGWVRAARVDKFARAMQRLVITRVDGHGGWSDYLDRVPNATMRSLPDA